MQPAVERPVNQDPAANDPAADVVGLEQAIEQLRVAEEELRVQNEELKANREATASALDRYQELFDLAPDAYLTTDTLGIIQEANSAAARLLNMPAEILRGKPVSGFVSPGKRRAFRVGLNRIAAGQEPVPGAEEWTVQIRPRKGEVLEVSVAASSVRGRTGEAASLRWLLRDVTSRRKAETEVRTLNAELEQRVQERTAALEAANWAKAEFLSVMAHELRTPLNAIIGYAELLDMEISGPVTDMQRVYLDRIRSSGARLIGLVGEVLDLGKVEAGQLAVVREECSIGDAVDAALAVILPQAASRGIRLRNMCDPADPIHYIGDSSRVEQILINLLTNAVKFTDAGGLIEVSCARNSAHTVDHERPVTNTWMSLSVRDTGIGLSPEATMKIFDPFVQVERPLTRTRGGTGLGLTISRRLARLMGGDLTVTSTPGSGSTFTLWLPATAEEGAQSSEEVERRAPARYVQGIARLGKELLEQIDCIVRAYSRALKSKSGIAKARELTPSELEDHAAAFLADIFQALVAVEDARGGGSGVMRDGSVLRRIVSERHGAQRYRLGWTEEEMRTEFEILRKCVDNAARNIGGDEKEASTRAALNAARTILGRLLNTAEEVSLRGFRLAGMDELQNTRRSV